MFKYNRLKVIFNALLLVLLSTSAIADEGVPAAAGSWLSITPPLLAIVFALTVKRVIPALFFGIWLGAWIIHDFGLSGLWKSLLDTFQVYILRSLANPDHAAIILF